MTDEPHDHPEHHHPLHHGADDPDHHRSKFFNHGRQQQLERRQR